MFQEAFKYYKAKNPPPELNNVIDLSREDALGLDSRLKDISKTIVPNIRFPGVIDTKLWRAFELVNRPGLVIIQNPFTEHGQRYWIARSVCDYPKYPNRTNLPAYVIARYSSHSSESENEQQSFDWWKTGQAIEEPQERIKFLKTLRWTTLGYHYDWTNKVYDEAAKAPFPTDLACLCRHFAKSLGFDQFQPEAAIVNYYPVGSTLAGHTDHSEKNLDAPLFSFSFGQPAVFLIGGLTKDEQPDACCCLLLRSGDVIVMTQASRLCYHAVPRVFTDCTAQQLWNEKQQLANNQSLEEPEAQTILCSGTISAVAATACHQTTGKNLHWSAFVDYISNSRININIRQVLNEGENQL
ncbi:LOW QUALITY PROTEIN: nucleic acid dioxygenase ALKBH1 [Sabethes cyaneus]|uniref:LOW QUALITY PROTEIN: nucleic acid dioxygenase ALKBH1 n=1 Tax=Sabethes cyaneus TaxID=53552 RepID=UPI00237E2D82|nr:LOW QUALITY PROTEIN: nucleic acid dioxygenase ALKBH1 [Sabethes cyaneus]